MKSGKTNEKPTLMATQSGQVLAAMLVAQTIHQNQEPIFGAYVIGRDWYFLILEGKNYSISRGFDATTEQVYDIYKILKALKNKILSIIK